jgi:hypothetical protein
MNEQQILQLLMQMGNPMMAGQPGGGMQNRNAMQQMVMQQMMAGNPMMGQQQQPQMPDPRMMQAQQMLQQQGGAQPQNRMRNRREQYPTAAAPGGMARAMFG